MIRCTNNLILKEGMSYLYRNGSKLWLKQNGILDFRKIAEVAFGLTVSKVVER